MDEVQKSTPHELIYCRREAENNNNRNQSQYLGLDNRTDDPLRSPEITVALNEGTAVLPFRPLEEPEEDMFDYETDVSLHESGTDSEEQVVPSSQLGSSYKYPEETFMSDSEPDEGIENDSFEEYPASPGAELIDNNNRHDPQPP